MFGVAKGEWYVVSTGNQQITKQRSQVSTRITLSRPFVQIWWKKSDLQLRP